MTTRSLWQVSPSQIQVLEDYQLRDLMQALLWAEAVRCQANRSQVCVNQVLKAGDEGCDGESPAHSGSGDWMPVDMTCWQLKAGSAGEPAKLRGEVLKKIPRATLAAGGAYVVVASRASGKRQISARLKVLCAEASSAGLPIDKIRVYDCERLANWVNQFLNVAVRLTGFHEGLLLFEHWERLEQFAGKYHASDGVAKQIEAMERELNFASGGLRHLHIVGPPGVGKTRLALEIVRIPVLADLLVYFDSFRPDIVDLLASGRSAALHLTAPAGVVPRSGSDGSLRRQTTESSRQAAQRCRTRGILCAP